MELMSHALISTLAKTRVAQCAQQTRLPFGKSTSVVSGALDLIWMF